MEDLRVVDSATQLDASARGSVAVCGSHGALYAAWLAANARVRAVILNDAGIGKHSAGVAGPAGVGAVRLGAYALRHCIARPWERCGKLRKQRGAAATPVHAPP